MRKWTAPPRLWAVGCGLWALGGNGSFLKPTPAQPSRLRQVYGGQASFLLSPVSCLLPSGEDE